MCVYNTLMGLNEGEQKINRQIGRKKFLNVPAVYILGNRELHFPVSDFLRPLCLKQNASEYIRLYKPRINDKSAVTGYFLRAPLRMAAKYSA